MLEPNEIVSITGLDESRLEEVLQGNDAERIFKGGRFNLVQLISFMNDRNFQIEAERLFGEYVKRTSKH